MKALAIVMGFALLLTAGTASRAGAAVLLEAITALAENVLGPGQVTSVRTSDNGTQVIIRWESATYKAGNKLATTRELMYSEAQLATGSIMGRIQEVTRVRFTIVKKKQMLATGDNVRGRGVSLVFATHLGGGTYVPPEPKIDPTKRPGGDSAKEL